ncbi:DNA polymerase IV [Alteromonas gracilis]
MSAPVMHVDMDAFYAAVMIRDRPELADAPVIVGGGHRGVVLSASYAAREHGVRSAMPMTRARRMCPEAVVIPPDYQAFESVSASVMEVFRRFSPRVEPLSLDEAFLDLAGTRGEPRTIAEAIRARVHDEQRITCSVGIAPAPSVAKLASRRAKPDGIVEVLPDEVTSFLHPLDVGELYGVGERTRDQLHRLGLLTAGDVAHTPVSVLVRALGQAQGRHVHDLAWGRDERRIRAYFGHGQAERSMGADETFGQDTDDPAVVLREVLRLTAKVTARMRAAGLAGRTVALRIRFSDFTTISRSRTLPEATDVTSEVYATASALFGALGLQRARIRLVGVRVEGLVPRETVHRQLHLGEREHGWAEADRAVDRAVSRFGSAAVRPATLLSGDRP